MKRRRFCAATAVLASLAYAGVSRAQSKPVVIGWLNAGSRESSGHLLVALKEGLASYGWKEGAQYVIEERWAAARMGQLTMLAEQLAAAKPAIIVAAPSQAVAAASKAAPTTPVVHATGADPVVTGLVKSLARPGGMITGMSNVVGNTTEKLLEVLLAAAPKVRRVGFLLDATNLARAFLMETARRSAASYSIDARFAEVGTAEEIEPALARFAKEGVQALIAVASPLLLTERRLVIRLATAQRWPVVGWAREWPEDGALLSYGVDTTANYRRSAYFVDRILKGAKPGDLPIEQPTKIEMILNKKTAHALGLTLPQTILLQADRVIE